MTQDADVFARGHDPAAVVHSGLGIANVMVRRGATKPLAELMRRLFNLQLPCGPHIEAAGDVRLLGIGSGAWLALSDQGGSAFSHSLAGALGEFASVTDQSDAYVVLRLSGPHVRDKLCRLVAIDVHARAFKVGDVASTVASHIGVVIWRLDDQPDGSPAFEIAVPRSMAVSLRSVLDASASQLSL